MLKLLLYYISKFSKKNETIVIAKFEITNIIRLLLFEKKKFLFFFF